MTNALARALDAAVQMIDTSIVRVRQHGACIGSEQKTVDGPVNEPICFSPHLYRARNLVERFFNRIKKQCRRVATRYDKLAANYLAFVQLASIRLWLRIVNALALLWHFRLGCKEHVTVRTLSGWRSCEEVEDRLPDGRHAWLWWRS